MGLWDRPYMRRDPGESPYGGGFGRGGISLPRPTPVVKLLLIGNLVVFVVQMFLDQPAPGYPAGRMKAWLGVTVAGFWQVWRYLTCQFLHADIWHIVLNMLGVYFLGVPLERHWGSRRFAVFYLSCGAAAGAAYVIIGALSGLPATIPIIGASGGVYAIVLAAAVLFPGFYLILLFFPVPIRLAALIVFGAMILFVLQALGAGQVQAAMSDVAHLGGAVAAGVWIWGVPRIRRWSIFAAGARGRGRWEKKLRRQRRQQQEVDRILDRIRREGIASLSWRDRRALRKASDRRRRQEQELR